MAVIKKTRTNDFRDLDLDFTVHPGTSDVSFKLGEEAIKRSIRNLVLTNFYEKPFRSHIGSNVYKMLFENFTNITSINIQDIVTELITNYEPRVQLLNVIVREDTDDHSIVIGLKYMIKNRMEPTISTIILERIR